MGDTSSCFMGGSDALEGVFGDGRKAAVCGSPASRRGNGGSLQGVWDLAQDRLQNLRSLPGVWGARVDGPQPTALPLCASASLPGGKLHPEREARARDLGCPQDSRAPPAQILRNSHPGESAQEALANLAGTPGRVLALHVQDEVFHLEGKLMRIAVGPSAAVRQPLHPTLLVATEDFVACLARDPKLPAEIRHLLAG